MAAEWNHHETSIINPRVKSPCLKSQRATLANVVSFRWRPKHTQPLRRRDTVQSRAHTTWAAAWLDVAWCSEGMDVLTATWQCHAMSLFFIAKYSKIVISCYFLFSGSLFCREFCCSPFFGFPALLFRIKFLAKCSLIAEWATSSWNMLDKSRQ